MQVASIRIPPIPFNDAPGQITGERNVRRRNPDFAVPPACRQNLLRPIKRSLAKLVLGKGVKLEKDAARACGTVAQHNEGTVIGEVLNDLGLNRCLTVV
jgi:hypothetical protein